MAVGKENCKLLHFNSFYVYPSLSFTLSLTKLSAVFLILQHNHLIIFRIRKSSRLVPLLCVLHFYYIPQSNNIIIAITSLFHCSKFV